MPFNFSSSRARTAASRLSASSARPWTSERTNSCCLEMVQCAPRLSASRALSRCPRRSIQPPTFPSRRKSMACATVSISCPRAPPTLVSIVCLTYCVITGGRESLSVAHIVPAAVVRADFASCTALAARHPGHFCHILFIFRSAAKRLDPPISSRLSSLSELDDVWESSSWLPFFLSFFFFFFPILLAFLVIFRLLFRTGSNPVPLKTSSRGLCPLSLSLELLSSLLWSLPLFSSFFFFSFFFPFLSSFFSFFFFFFFFFLDLSSSLGESFSPLSSPALSAALLNLSFSSSTSITSSRFVIHSSFPLSVCSKVVPWMIVEPERTPAQVLGHMCTASFFSFSPLSSLRSSSSRVPVTLKSMKGWAPSR